MRSVTLEMCSNGYIVTRQDDGFPIERNVYIDVIAALADIASATGNGNLAIERRAVPTTERTT